MALVQSRHALQLAHARVQRIIKGVVVAQTTSLDIGAVAPHRAVDVFRFTIGLSPELVLVLQAQVVAGARTVRCGIEGIQWVSRAWQEQPCRDLKSHIGEEHAVFICRGAASTVCTMTLRRLCIESSQAALIDFQAPS